MRGVPTDVRAGALFRERRQSGSAESDGPTALAPVCVSAIDGPFAIASLSTYQPDHLHTLRIFLSHFLAMLLELISAFTELYVGIGTRTTNLMCIAEVPTMSSEPVSNDESERVKEMC